MGTLLLIVVVGLDLVLLVLLALVLQRASRSAIPAEALEQVARQAETLHQNLSQQFASATADMAMRLVDVRLPAYG